MPEMVFDISYAAQSDRQRLDIYLPGKGKGPIPVIIWFHPGGFTQGDKEMVQPLTGAILKRGYAVVSADYRLADEAIFPAQIQDAKTSVRWVRANAVKYNFDLGKIACWGISAGSTIAALVGTSAGVKELEDLSTGNSGESSRVDAVVSWYGPMDFNALESHHLQLGQKPLQDPDISGESRMMGGSVSELPERYRAASPINYISHECPPFFIQHGKSDDVIPYLQSVLFAGALESAIGKERVKLRLIENAGHFDRVHSSPENLNAALDFLDKHLDFSMQSLQ
ncbi:MAG: alpha/beta hydrolase [Dehalococcoidales bacterium]|nr:alpha/beta hydrolase [Dehalococcoidales bacterium]